MSEGVHPDYLASRRSQLADAARRDAEAEAEQAAQEVTRGALERRAGGDWVAGVIHDSHGKQLTVVCHANDFVSIKDGHWVALQIKHSQVRALIDALEKAAPPRG